MPHEPAAEHQSRGLVLHEVGRRQRSRKGAVTGYLVRGSSRRSSSSSASTLLTFLLSQARPGRRRPRGPRAAGDAGRDRAVQPRVNGYDLSIFHQFCDYAGGSSSTATSATRTSTTRPSPRSSSRPSEDARARRPLDDLRAGRRDPARHPPGRPPQHADRLRPHRRLVRRLRDAGVPARGAAHPLVRDRPRLVLDSRRRRCSPVWGILTDPRRLVLPGHHPGRDHDRRVQPLHALVDDGDDDRGLHPHGAGEGRRVRSGCSTGTRCGTP